MTSKQQDRDKLKQIVEGLGGEFSPSLPKDEPELWNKANMLWMRWKGLNDLFYLGNDILGLGKAKDRRGKSIVDPKLHRWLCGLLEREGDKMILIPRRHAKTFWVKVRIMQLILQAPDTVRVALYSKTSNLVEAELKSIIRMFQTPLLMQLFPDVIPQPGKNMNGWTRVTANMLTIKRGGETVPQENQLEVYGAGATVTGKHFDDHFYDDILNEDDANSPEGNRKVIEWYGYIQGVLEPGGTETVTGTPYHYSDLYHYIEQERIYGDAVFKRPAIVANKPIYSFYTLKMLDRMKKRMGNYMFCTPAETPIWMGDGTFKRIVDVREGDEVIGFEYPEKGRVRLKRTKVTAKSSGRGIVQTIKLESGRRARCTANHKWFTGKNGGDHHKMYSPVTDRPGPQGIRHLVPVIDIPAKMSRSEVADYGWLGGILDGEGACKHQAVAIHQSAVNPEVLEKIETTLDRLGIGFIKSRKTDEKFKDVFSFTLLGGRQMKVDLINRAGPAKSGQLMDSIMRNPGGVSSNGAAGDRVSVIEVDGEEDVYGLETETGNYVAWGFASQNSSQMMINTIPQEDQLFPPPQPVWQTPNLPGQMEQYRWYITIDPAASTQKYSDETAITVAAINSQGWVYVQECFGVKKTGDQIAQIILQLNERYKPLKIGMESGLQEHLATVIRLVQKQWEDAQGRKISLPLISLPIKRVDKFQRINLTLGSFVRSGKIFFHPKLHRLFEQMEKINPNYEGKDDLVDSVAMLFQLVDQFSFKSWENPLYETLHVGGLGFTILDKLHAAQNKKMSWEERIKV